MKFSLHLIFVIFQITFTYSQETCGQINNKNILQNDDTVSSNANWPWLASLFYHFNNQYFCSGTLISERHVLSVAHCFSGSNFSTPAQEVYIILNSKYLPKTLSSSTIFPTDQMRKVSAIKTHKNWKKIDGNFDSDIAILVLTKRVKFSLDTQPICLPSLNSILPQSGTIVGFTKSSENKSISLTEVKVSNITSCLLGDESSCTIHNEEFTCTSQSSSGFYSEDENGKFTITGLFSMGLRLEDSQVCSLNNFIVFTFVGQFIDWIQMVMKEVNLEGNEREAKRIKSEISDVFCDYRWNYEQSLPLYTCIVRGLMIPSTESSYISSIIGLHGDGDNDEDVNRIHILRSKITFLPDMTKLSQKFVNFKNLWVQKSELKFVERFKLQSLVNLTILSLSENLIEEIPEDSFDDLINLEILWLNSNRIMKLNENLLANLPNLKVFDARNNLIKILPEKFFENNKKLKTVNFEFNSLKKIDVDFNSMKSLKWVVLNKNECIDLSYCKNFDCLKAIKNLQEAIDVSC
ncbi:hypothetical protein PVAND_016028 [Polypedilum vanderplanki]|uniref:Peptidase S1 domain-containing protein n=1 Tax=Polypedilum vanderplanki TaxID=319348 RepID=A0A9J6BDW9_POLVA|nr:hypothetical protein PVAND_016028 [Polypedilum vanderplanki]